MEINLTTPQGGWTVKTFREALASLPEDMTIKAFLPSDPNGPHSWADLDLDLAEDGELHIWPDFEYDGPYAK